MAHRERSNLHVLALCLLGTCAGKNGHGHGHGHGHGGGARPLCSGGNRALAVELRSCPTFSGSRGELADFSGSFVVLQKLSVLAMSPRFATTKAGGRGGHSVRRMVPMAVDL